MEKNGLPRREFMKSALASGAGLTLATSSHSANAQEPAAPEKPQKVPRKMLGTTAYLFLYCSWAAAKHSTLNTINACTVLTNLA